MKRPDAFTIDSLTSTVTCFEVVGTSDFCPTQYAELWWILDCEEWRLRVKVLSKHGAPIGDYSESDLGEIWYGRLIEDALAPTLREQEASAP